MAMHCSDAEEAEHRWEAIHGPVNRWTLGVIDQAGRYENTEDVPDRDTAVTTLQQIAGDVPDADNGSNEAAWDAFYDKLETSTDDVVVTGPDGRRYYAELIQS